MRTFFIEFMIYSIFGYVLECIYSSIIEKKIIFNRGFLIGPYCPIYGVSLLCVNVIVNKCAGIFLQIFLSCIFIASLEYMTAFILEKLFNRTWWDYSRKRYNIKGRVCLDNIIIFGIGSVFMVKEITPFLDKILNIENNFYLILSFSLFVMFFIDFSISLRRHFQKSNFLK